MTLTEFLLARIDEDEKRATWHHRLLCLRTGCEVCVFGDDEDAIAAERVCTCDYPGRVLAECEAKRQLVHEWQTFSAVAKSNPTDQRALHVQISAVGIAQGLDRAMRHAAAIHAGHPDYNPEWRP